MNFISYIPFVKRYESCVGFSFPSIGRCKWEIWICPAGYTIAHHSHPDLDIELIFITGHDTTFYRQRDKIESATMRWWKPFRKFTIKRNDIHWFSVSKWPLVFLNIECWYKEPTSASESFKLA